ncbi:Arginine-tRNA-protein transferase C-terminal [Penicillium paradoxum]|uniref:Arginine-tRNA-protein transferase C-terminal n=1 Tax=Penicillium paradoxum TaxID=176176 RepID=UPI002549128E|nr:Arginine-tRNA-protein transferase C-terminal [Penicillium paradoxum]KAJ5773007.1 Arginine-tRNA-protein transferase C-terminal [Penicillium paradoxum]
MQRVDAKRASELSLFRPLGASYYANSTSVHPEHYEDLINGGWRRSGNLYYKQNLLQSCCPHYTLRLEATAYRPRRDQRKAINKWNKFILGPEYMRKAARLCPRTREEKKHRKCNFDLVSAVHLSEYDNVKRPIDPATKRPIEPAHRFEVTIEGDSVSQAKFELFVKYQTAIHKEDVSHWKPKDFQRFLCTGIKRSPNPLAANNASEKKVGSWHQCYRLDGELIAVAVLDLVPSGVSSVYVFYDPAYEQWEIGKLSAMREIAFSVENQYPYYYMGYYIHSCQKMRYKANFRPQYILDPESGDWDPLDGELAEKLNSRSYVSLSRDRASSPAPLVSENETNADADDVSLFEIGMPGILTLSQVEELDLDHWLLFVKNNLVHMKDLVKWETMSMTSPMSIKGIIAELAAVLGPKVVRNSAVDLFG